MLEKGRWYRNPGGGVLFVERVLFAERAGFSTAEVVIFRKVRETKRIAIEPGAMLVLASYEEVSRFTTEKDRQRPDFFCPEGARRQPKEAPNAVMPERPEYVEDEHLVFLDELRVSGVTNMWGAGEYLQEELGLCEDEAKGVLVYWMKTFGKEGR